MNKLILWFRRDLRLADNPALHWAIEQQAAILPIYIHSPEEEAPWAPGGASRWWLHHSLMELESRLAERGLTLHCYRGPAKDILVGLMREKDIQALAVNRLYEPHLAKRDEALMRVLEKQGVTARLFDSNLLFTPGTLLNQQDKPYRVFTPFWRQARKRLEVAPPDTVPIPLPDRLPGERCAKFGDVADLALLDAHPWHSKLHEHWQPGENAAHQQLDRFMQDGLLNYQIDREFPALRGSSRLSPHLHFGEISPRQIVHRLMDHMLGSTSGCLASIERFLTELGWREFSHHVLWHFPNSDRLSMNPRFKDNFWTEDPEALAAWQSGQTGIPIIDAGMRELWETGWMHNRVRMLVGSFLTKNLGIHWRTGARWFWDTLVDADLANNSLGWQWIAGCGVDAAPYYRIFNPETQAQKFDPQQTYVRTWLDDRPQAKPLVNLAESRQLALERFRHI